MSLGNINKSDISKENRFLYRFAFIGVGNMGSAIIEGFLKAGIVKKNDIILFDIDKNKLDTYRKLGISVATDLKSAVYGSEFTIIALKPSVVALSMRELSTDKNSFINTTFVSIAAAVPTGFICENLGAEVPVIRTMPSTPMLIGKGAVAISRNDLVDKKSFEYICRAFSEVAEVSVMDESKMNRIISVNGSSPAYVYLFVKAMLEYALEQGITKEQALPLILRTVEGSVEMIRTSDQEIEELIKKVASSNGTTLAALDSFYKDDFEGIIKKAMEACSVRADQISKELRA